MSEWKWCNFVIGFQTFWELVIRSNSRQVMEFGWTYDTTVALLLVSRRISPDCLSLLTRREKDRNSPGTYGSHWAYRLKIENSRNTCGHVCIAKLVGLSGSDIRLVETIAKDELVAAIWILIRVWMNLVVRTCNAIYLDQRYLCEPRWLTLGGAVWALILFMISRNPSRPSLLLSPTEMKTTGTALATPMVYFKKS
jgi:hypothetical protein